MVRRLTHFCSSHDEVDTCLAEIERTISNIHGGSLCAVYLLDRQYQNFKRFTRTEDFPVYLSVDFTISDTTTRTWYCRRNSTVVGLILVKVKDELVHEMDLEVISDIVCMIYSRLFSANLFAHMHAPINFHQPEESFFKELGLLVEISSAMCAGALRELNKDGKSLTTIFAWNLDYDGGQNSDWDIDSLDLVPELKEAVETRKAKAINSLDITKRPFFRRPEQAKINSAVFCPVLVGTEIFGVLSFAQHIPYEYSELEVNGFLSIANSVGIAVQNFRQASKQSEEIGGSVRNSTVFTAVEVAQAARHTAKGVIDTVNVQLAGLLHIAQSKNVGAAEMRQSIVSNLDALSDHIFVITKALDDIKAATKPPKNELVTYGLRKIWEEAKNQLLGKLNNYRINSKWDGPELEIQCYPDQIRQVFLNLIINSIDAFTRGGITSKKLILIRAEALANVKNVKLTYVDNAGGLDIRGLLPWKKGENDDYSQLIFDKDVTTKGEDGSGWGLYICRRVMSRHQGSIDLVDYRKGMTFVIHLPRQLLDE